MHVMKGWKSYKIYSIYELTNNITALLLLHGIQAGNENKSCWEKRSAFYETFSDLKSN